MKSDIELLNRKIREKGYRMTRQRRVVLEELAKVDYHPRADELFQMVRRRLPTISFGTVYRNLRTLQELGLLSKVRFGSKSARFDANTGRHQHFVCEHCEKIIDIDVDLGLDLDIPGLKQKGYQVNSARIQLLGLCPSCRKKARK